MREQRKNIVQYSNFLNLPKPSHDISELNKKDPTQIRQEEFERQYEQTQN